MDPDDMLAGLREDAQDQIAANALALDQAPSTEGQTYAPADAYGDTGGGDPAPVQFASSAPPPAPAPAPAPAPTPGPQGQGDSASGWKDVGQGMIDSAQATMDRFKKTLPPPSTSMEKAAQRIGGLAAHAPGNLLNVVTIATAPDKWRATAGVIGSELGGDLGALVPGAEPITVPLGAWAGGKAGEYLYDHRHSIGDFLGRLGAATANVPAW